MSKANLVLQVQKELKNLDSRSRHVLLTLADVVDVESYDLLPKNQSELVRVTGLCHITVKRCINNLLSKEYIILLNGNLHLNSDKLSAIAAGEEVVPRELYNNLQQAA